MEELVKAWYDDRPQQAGVFLYALSQKYGTQDGEELFKRFKAAEADKYNKLKTGLEGRYQATQADVEREVGRAALNKGGQSANGELERLREELQQAKDREQANDFALYSRQVKSQLSGGGLSTVIFNDAEFLNRIASAMYAANVSAREAMAIYRLARTLDDNNSKPSAVAIELSVESLAGGNRLTARDSGRPVG